MLRAVSTTIGGSWSGGKSGWSHGRGWGYAGRARASSSGVGAPFWYPFGWYPYGYAYSYPFPVYAPSAVVVESAPQTYIQQGDGQAEAQHYWYFCRPSKTYYPYVKECPEGWLQVVPQTSPPTE